MAPFLGPSLVGLILVPNGKLIGQSLGDRYPAEEALERAKLERDWDEDSWGRTVADGGKEGPGGRFYGAGQEDEETKLFRRLGQRRKPSVSTTTGNSTLDERDDAAAGVQRQMKSPRWES